MTRTGVYALSADPITMGHIELATRAAGNYDQLVVAIGQNPGKKYLFSLEERLEMARRSPLSLIPNVRIDSFKGLLVDYAFTNGIGYLVRGIRDEKDREAEGIYARVVEDQNLGIKVETIDAHQDYKHISSSLVKLAEIDNGLFGLKPSYVTPYVKQCLEARMLDKYFVGVTGAIGCGKSYVCEKLVEQGRQKNIPTHYIDMDRIGHLILGNCSLPMAVTARGEVAKTFGSDFVNLDGSINRQKLGEQVFVYPDRMEALSQIVSKPLFVYLRDQVLSDKKGLILLEAALFAETGIADWCNYNLLLVRADSATQERRIAARDRITPDKIQRRVNSQFSGEKKRDILEEQIRENHNGKLWNFDDPDGLPKESFGQLFDQVVNEMDIYGTLRETK